MPLHVGGRLHVGDDTDGRLAQLQRLARHVEDGRLAGLRRQWQHTQLVVVARVRTLGVKNLCLCETWQNNIKKLACCSVDGIELDQSCAKGFIFLYGCFKRSKHK